MRLAEEEALVRLAAHDHGILCTVHAERGVDAVPVAYVVDEDGYVGVPVDRVKPKASSRLQRERNLEADPRATLLVEHWDAGDWSQLWWVRADGTAAVWFDGPECERGLGLLRAKYPQYEHVSLVGPVIAVAVEKWASWPREFE